MLLSRPALFLSAAFCVAGGLATASENWSDTVWKLQSLDGENVSSLVTLTFDKENRVAGQAPCNRYFGSNEAELPDFRMGPIGSTRMACEHLELEGTYFAALMAMRTAEISENKLILRSPEGAQLIYVPAE